MIPQRFGPVAHHKGIIGGYDGNLVNALSLKILRPLDEAWDMLLRALNG